MNDDADLSLTGMTMEQLKQRLAEEKAKYKNFKKISTGWVKLDENRIQRTTITRNKVSVETRTVFKRGEGKGHDPKAKQ